VEKPREIAVRILRRYAEGADYLDDLLEMELRRGALAPADRGLVQELAFGVVRWQATLDWLIAQKTAYRPQKPVLQILLRLGLYQLFWLERIPDHAAVHETVEMARRLGFNSQAGFLNALLRGYLREREQTEAKLEELRLHHPALGYSHPDWLVKRWQQRWGEENTRRLLEWNNTPPVTFARLNTLKADAASLAQQWQNEGVQFVPRQWDWTGADEVFELKSHPPLASLASFQQGLFYIQDPSTLLAVQTLGPQPGESLLDICAAPGGKTTLIAQQIQNQGHILAQDISPTRLDLVRQNCDRLGVTCVQTSLLAGMAQERGPSPGQPRRPDQTAPGPSAPPFDRVLVDAPCSNTGVMRRRVDLRWRVRPEELERLRRMQLELLQRAAMQVKAGGTIVYSTCSLEPEENRQVVDEFLAAHPGFRLTQERTLLPFVEGVDGAYLAQLRLD